MEPDILYCGQELALPHDHPFDPSYGCKLADFLVVGCPEEPADFRTFWQDTYEQNARLKLNAVRREIPLAYETDTGDFRSYEVFYDSWDNRRIGAVLRIPQHEPVTCAMVCGHGYGGREDFPAELLIPGCAWIFPLLRGFGLSRAPDLPANDANRHVVHGIESRETYILRGCAADLWNAVKVLREFCPGSLGRVFYSGCSFGGGMGALAAPWEPLLRKVWLDVPTFGNHSLRLCAECCGSGEAVRQLWTRKPEISATLRYYDAANAAACLRIPAMVSVALFDPVVPPQGQFAVANAVPVALRKRFIWSAGHADYPGRSDDWARLRRYLEDFFSS